MGLLKRLFRGSGTPEPDRRVAGVQRWADQIPGCMRIGDAVTREVVKVAGMVEGLRIRPRRGTPSIEATLSDGTGTCTAVWLGRRSIHGLTLGRRMVIEGRLAEKDGELQILNPTFEFADQREIEEHMRRKPGKES